jgi:excisionase family DNA binding protein
MARVKTKLTIAQAAEELQITHQAVQRAIASGKLPATRVTFQPHGWHAYLIRRADLDSYAALTAVARAGQIKRYSRRKKQVRKP